MIRPGAVLLRGQFLALALLAARAERAVSQAPSWKTYVDSVHGFAFSYPSAYQPRKELQSVFLTHGRERTEVYVEDWTRSVTRGASRWDLAALAADRGEASCMADGPRCSTSCKARTVDEIPNAHDMRVVMVNRKRFDTCERPDSTRPIDPLFVADLSGGGSYYLLLFGARLDEPGVPVDTLRAIVATLRRLGDEKK